MIQKDGRPRVALDDTTARLVAAEAELAEAVRQLAPVPFGDKLMASAAVELSFEKLRVAHAMVTGARSRAPRAR